MLVKNTNTSMKQTSKHIRDPVGDFPDESDHEFDLKPAIPKLSAGNMVEIAKVYLPDSSIMAAIFTNYSFAGRHS